MMEVLKERAQQVVDHATKIGATAVDAFIREDEVFTVTVRKGDVEKLQEAVSRSLRLRIFLGKRTATSQTSDLSPSIIQDLVEETFEMARLTSEDESSGLPDKALYPLHIPDLDLADSAWDTVTTAQGIDLARRAETAAIEANPAITNSEGGSFERERSRTVIANSAGFVGGYETTMGYLVAVPIAERNGAMQQDSWLSVARYRQELDAPEEVGRRAAERVLRKLDARKIATCEVPVIFDPLTARTIVRHIFDALSGDSVYRKRSFLVDQLGKPIASRDVTIVDDALLKRGIGSRPFDDEGVEAQKTAVLEDGVLRSYIQSAYTGKRLNARPTGNGTRTGAGSIAVGPTNFYLLPGQTPPDEIVASVKNGLYVVDLMGSGVNLVNGDYSRGVTGLWIENGKFTYPVHEITIAGNLRQMLQDITMVGNDIRFLGTVSSPTVKIRSMTLSGD
jgi:PmbA protein